ncbi:MULTISPECIES: sigma factor-like helix-turn-helix DNA-binding protein [unclassified Rhodococcus (in: high G+C Gram-positive bacteria)]|uniref:sigma factor-like helix-turn-helix DNA-binding protein n=1 Tax=unclassified Rhodococcus (in: high G+C Gram-positive bacteria) TaxID=192944 RepID=UPI0016399A5A|nr:MULTISPECIES: sigma factor-like helix-turn-helix DNA-binding protein [unclassified Rhodococcus (in: high G+C Gram-positive bacteria)]MBC2642557.1 siderophore-interacting protein [Rhodococcus sp. 3A]MBC2892701.1 siderophore-interacting protein [Rhodococcus sp. 4CII]
MSVLDEELHSAAAAAAAGDREAVRRVMTTLWPQIVRYCRTRVGISPQSVRPADEVAQEALLAVARELPSLARSDHPVREVYRIVSGTVAHGHPGSGNSDVPPEVARLLHDLDPTAREIVLLRVIDGLSAHDTAGVLGLPVSRVLVVQHEALRSLRATAA